jgi:hypothetical protein
MGSETAVASSVSDALDIGNVLILEAQRPNTVKNFLWIIQSEHPDLGFFFENRR